MGCYDVYCNKCGLPLRKIDDNKNIIPKDIQNILENGILVHNKKCIIVTNYDDYGKCKDMSGNTVNIGSILYVSKSESKLYHIGCGRYKRMLENREMVEKLYQGQIFNDKEYIKYYKSQII